MKKRSLKTAAAVLAVLMLTACGTAGKDLTAAGAAETAGTASAEQPEGNAGGSEAEAAQAEGTGDVFAEQTIVTLAAAASLEYAFSQEIIPAFEAVNPDIKIEGTYDSSGKLQTQIEAGLPADIFFSAATKQMNALNEAGYMDAGSITDYLENKIVLIVPQDSEKGIDSFEKLSDAETIALGDPESVPAGQYGKEALSAMGLWEAAEPKLSLGTNVTEVLNWVAEGSADCGIVYATDAATTDKVRVAAEVADGVLKTPVLYPVGMLARTPEETKEAAKRFFDYVLSEEAAAVFERYGFADYRG